MVAITTPPAVVGAIAATTTVSPGVIACAGTVVGRTYLAALARSGIDPITAVTDNGGNVWTRVTTEITGTVGRQMEWWITTATATFTSVSVAFTGPSFLTGTIVGVTGSSGVVNAQLANFRAASTTPAAVQITPTIANTLVLAAVMANGNSQAQISTAGPYTELAGGITAGPQIVWLLNPAASVATGPAYTFTTSVGSGHAILALEEAAAPPSGSKISKWNGSARTLAKVSKWNGSARVLGKIR